MIAPGGTPSVSPLSVATYAGRPPTFTFREVEPGRVEATIVHGFVAGDGGCAHPMIGEPARSGSQSTGEPLISTCVCFGISVTWPPWMQVIVAAEVTIGGISPRVSRV